MAAGEILTRSAQRAIHRRHSQRWQLLLMLAFSGAILAEPAEPGVLSLLMPGRLSSAHAGEENNCGACHQSFAKEAQDSLCLDCHDKIAADVEQHAGLHGRTYRPATGCVQCHREHLGREADISALEQDRFNHEQTDFRLVGAHRQAACGACHTGDASWREAPSACVACHRDDDRHHGGMGDDCGACHKESGWGDAGFDHGKTHFPLRGHHADTACNLCHAGERYEEMPRDCVACHAADDVHGGSLGRDCVSCHSEENWRDSSFDHGATRFPLRGGHRDTACGACHTAADIKQVAGTGCIDCHGIDDAHNGRNGPDCQQCHRETSWRETTFDHGRDTRFALRGKHADVACEACHFAGLPAHQGPVRACVACHRMDDVHSGAEGENCVSCHRESGWGEVRFSHDLAGFPLLGMHRLLACGSCHLDQAYADTPNMCIDCHAQDDTHTGTLGRECADCHNPAGWSLWQFDHDAATRFPLAGAHTGLVCQDCHVAGAELALPMDCFSCHRGDDRHRGRFGRDCGRCHNTENFGEVKMLR